MTGSNIDLGPKIIPLIASIDDSNLLVFSVKFYDASFGNAKGGRTCPGEGGETPYPGEG